jgi:molecular chaperone GrpE
MTDKQELEKLKKDLKRLESDILEKNEEIQKKDDEINEMEIKADDYHSQLLRLQADFENYKKRSEKEIKEYIKYANEGLILKVIDAYEDLERALKAEKSHDLKEGVEIIHKKLKDILEGEGLCEIDASGDKFDPYKHEALMVEDHKDYDEGIVIEELGKGYTLDSKVIKYSKVKVCKKK